MAKSYLVTGGAGFIGAVFVKRLLREGNTVRVLDNYSRASSTRLADIQHECEITAGDIRNPSTVMECVKGVDCVCHLAAINGTENFYTKPNEVLDVGVRGILNVIEACLKQGVKELMVASTSEVYQTPSFIPTDEKVPLTIPDPFNPRYSYAASKMISEIIAINCGREYFDRVIIFRPHNVYGPDMGWEHVIPQFAVRLKKLAENVAGTVRFPVLGSGRETRAFVFIEDFIEGLMLLAKHGKKGVEIYNIGTTEEVAIEQLANRAGKFFGKKIVIVPGKTPEGSTLRRCPDISKISALGYKPKYLLEKGLPLTLSWYEEHMSEAPGVLTGSRGSR